MCNFQIEFYWTKDAELIPVKEASLVPYRQFLVTLAGLAPVLLQHLTGGKQWTSTERRFDLSTWSLYNVYMSINLAQVKAKRLIWSFVNNSMRKAETQTGGSPGTTHAYIIKSSILIALIYIYHCNQGRPLIISKWATCRVNIWFLRTDNEPRS